jgi:hypothetical protein
MLSSEVVGPGAASQWHSAAPCQKCQSDGVLAGDNGDGSSQLWWRTTVVTPLVALLVGSIGGSSNMDTAISVRSWTSNFVIFIFFCIIWPFSYSLTWCSAFPINISYYSVLFNFLFLHQFFKCLSLFYINVPLKIFACVYYFPKLNPAHPSVWLKKVFSPRLLLTLAPYNDPFLVASALPPCHGVGGGGALCGGPELVLKVQWPFFCKLYVLKSPVLKLQGHLQPYANISWSF